MQAQRILIAEDYASALIGLTVLAEKVGFAKTDIFETKTTHNIIPLIKQESINFLLLDIQFGNENKGLQLLPELQKNFPQLKVLIQTHLANDLILGRSITSHAIVRGLLSKNADDTEYITALQGLKTGSRDFYTCHETKKFLAKYEESKRFQLTQDEAFLLFAYQQCGHSLKKMAEKYAKEKPKAGDSKYWNNRMKREFQALRDRFAQEFNQEIDNDKLLAHEITQAAFLKYGLQ